MSFTTLTPVSASPFPQRSSRALSSVCTLTLFLSRRWPPRPTTLTPVSASPFPQRSSRALSCVCTLTLFLSLVLQRHQRLSWSDRRITASAPVRKGSAPLDGAVSLDVQPWVVLVVAPTSASPESFKVAAVRRDHRHQMHVLKHCVGPSHPPAAQ